MAGRLARLLRRDVRRDALGQMARRAEHTGVFLAAGATPYTFQRTLTSRSNLDQAIVTGLSVLAVQTAASAIQSSIQALARLAVGSPTDAEQARRWSRAAVAADVAAFGLGLLAQRAVRQQPGEHLARAAVRSTGWLVSGVAAAGTVLGAIDEAYSGRRDGSPGHPALAATLAAGAFAGLREYDRRRAERRDEGSGLEAVDVSTLRSLAMAAGVAVGATAAGRAEARLADRIASTAAAVLPGDTAVWRPVGHTASVAAIVAAGRALMHQAFQRIEGRESAFEPALDIPPLDDTVSGGPGSLVPYETLARMGRRFVWTLRRGVEIERVTGQPARNEPIRVYVGLDSAPTPGERVELAIAELERTGGFDRPWLMVVSPTGTGYVNYAAAGALEFLTGGDCATVAMQYSARPSPLSLDRVSGGRDQARRLLEAVHGRLAGRERRPHVVLFGESLGAWTSQDAFIHEGTKGLEELGIDHAIWIGTPEESGWKREVLGDDDDPRIDRSTVGVFNDIDEWRAMDEGRRAGIRYVMVTHNNDGVARFGLDLLVQSPAWLGAPEARPVGIPRGQRWAPVTTFVQTLVDMKNAARVIPGEFAATGHDYRADLVPFFDAVLGFDAGPELLDRLTAGLEAEELRRVNWITAHKTVGGGMAVAVLDKIRQQHPEVLRGALEQVGADIRAAVGAIDAVESEPTSG